VVTPEYFIIEQIAPVGRLMNWFPENEVLSYETVRRKYDPKRISIKPKSNRSNSEGVLLQKMI